MADGNGNNFFTVDSGMQVPVDITAGGAGKTAYIIDNGMAGGNLSIAGNNSIVEAGNGPETITDTGTNDVIVAGGRSPGNGGPPPTPPQPQTVNADSSTTILWNSDYGGALKINGTGGTSQLIITSNDSQSMFAHGESISITQTSPGTTVFAHTMTGTPSTVLEAASIIGIPSVLLMLQAAVTNSRSVT